MAETLKRAYSTFEIKAAESPDGKRTFKGLASTPSVDSMGDVIEPKGMEIKLPTPLLWQHKSHEPIGWVRSANVTSKGIEVECEVANVMEPGALKDRMDSYWQMLKIGLVQGLSVGFQVVESARIEGSYGMHFLKTRLVELSTVTIPANEDCGLTAIKTADQTARRSMYGAHGTRTGVGHATGKSGSPEVSGTHRASRPFFIPE